MPANPCITSTLLAAALAAAAAAGPEPIRLDPIGSWRSGIFAQGGAEISAYDSKSKRLFVVNGASASLTVLDLSVPSAPALVATLPFRTC